MQQELINPPTSEDIAASCLNGVRKLQDRAVALENVKLRALLRDIVETIELHTDCMSNLIDRRPLESLIEIADKYKNDA